MSSEPSSPEVKTGRLEWLLGARWRAAVVVGLTSVIALSLPMLFWIPGALVVFLGLAKRPEACPAGLAAWIAGWTVSTLLQPLGFGWSVLIAVVWIAPAYGWVLASRRGAGFNNGFQTSLLLILGALGGVHLWMDDSAAFWTPILTEAVKPLGDVNTLLQRTGLSGEWDAAKIVVTAAQRMWGVMAWLVLMNSTAAVLGGLALMGRWLKRPVLGPTFVTLKVGRQLGWVAMALWLVTSFSDNAMASDAVWLFLGAFVLQGLSVLHAIAAQRRLRGLVVVYVLLIFPATTPVMQALLALAGYLDNWWDIRARLTSQS